MAQDALKAALLDKLKIGERQLSRRIQVRQSETLLPRRLAMLSLAAESGVPVGRFASDEDLAELRRTGQGAQRPATPSSTPSPASARGSVRSGATARPKPTKPTRGKKIWVVHGRNVKLQKELFAFLRSLNLEPIEFIKAIGATGKPSPSIPEILEAALQKAVAVVVLLTPDDEVVLKAEFQRASDPDYERAPTGQARANVLFEAGLAFGHAPNSTLIVQVGHVKPFSDVSGLHVVHLDNSPERRAELVTKLRNAGCTLDDSGADWYSTGDFTL